MTAELGPEPPRWIQRVEWAGPAPALELNPACFDWHKRRADELQVQFDRLLARDTDNLKRLIACQAERDAAHALLREAKLNWVEPGSSLWDRIAALVKP